MLAAGMSGDTEQTIARQAQEIERLRDALSLAATAGIIGSPVTHTRLLEMIVETGAHVIGAQAGALFLLDRVIGALELLDKQGGERFTAADMEALGLFAHQAAVALQLSRTYQNVARLLRESTGTADEQLDEPDGVDGDEASREALELANLVHEIARQG